MFRVGQFALNRAKQVYFTFILFFPNASLNPEENRSFVPAAAQLAPFANPGEDSPCSVHSSHPINPFLSLSDGSGTIHLRESLFARGIVVSHLGVLFLLRHRVPFILISFLLSVTNSKEGVFEGGEKGGGSHSGRKI